MKEKNNTLINIKYHEKLKRNQPVFIAEIGLNHNGKIQEAIELIHRAANAGADLVKFQIFNAEKFYSVYTKSLLNNEAPKYDDSTIQFFKRFELSFNDYTILQKEATECGVVFFASCFDDDSFDILEKLNVPLYKIASSEITNVPLLKKIALTKKPVIVSTGISLQQEITHAVELFQQHDCHIVLLHCVSLYPVPHTAINLMRIQKLHHHYKVPVGFSDHSKDTIAAIMAVALGARVFERHFKLSDTHDCVDKEVSLTPDEFKQYVDDITKACEMLGDGSIDYNELEEHVARSARRSIFAARDLPEGTILMQSDVIVKRPGVGLSPYYIEKIIGKRIKRNIQKDMPINENDIEI